MPARPKRSIRQVDLGAASAEHEHTESDITDLDHYDSSDFAADHANADHTHNHDADYADIAHTHELDELNATGATDGHVLTAQGDGTAAWEAPTGGGVTDHGDLTGLEDDDHPQYLTVTRHDADDHSSLTITESQISDLDHWDQADTEGVIDAYVDKTFVDALNVDADTLDGLDSTDFASSTHDHDADYAASDHTHELDELDATAATGGHVLTAQGDGTAAWEAPTTGVTDHGALTGLADDDHTQYLNDARHEAVHVAARMEKSNNQTLSNATTAVVTWDSEEYDTDGDLIDLANNRFVVQDSGIYVVVATVRFSAASSVGTRTVIIRVNGAANTVVAQPSPSASPRVQAIALISATAADTVDVQAIQDSGSNLDILAVQSSVAIARLI